MLRLLPTNIEKISEIAPKYWKNFFTPLVNRLIELDIKSLQTMDTLVKEEVNNDSNQQKLQDISNIILVRDLGDNIDWNYLFEQKLKFTETRDDKTVDQILILEHTPVFTQGLSGKPENILETPKDIPIIQTDRGGQITYHGPRQLIVYFLLDYARKKEVFSKKNQSFYSRTIVTALEQGVIFTLKALGISDAYAKPDAPGIYIDGKKVSSLGLKVKRQGTYHGIAINLDMDLSPFSLINPCGYAGLEMCNIKEYLPNYSSFLDDIEIPTFSDHDLEQAFNKNDVTNLNEYLQALGITSLNYQLLREFVKTYFVTFVTHYLDYQHILDYQAYNLD